MEKLIRAFQALGIPYSDRIVDKFQVYMEEILSWNEKVNLTAIKDREEFIEKHFIDSLLCYGFPEYEQAGKIIDVGTGAGFPGVPLALVSPDKEFVLMDSLNKRLKIIDQICGMIALKNQTTVHARAEELARNKDHREKYDLCVSRAVANLAVLCEYCLPFIKVGGALLAYKGPEVDREAAEAAGAIKTLGGSLERIAPAEIADFALSHNIIVIKKIKNTPSKFPRKSGTPAKEPLK